jgi:hypothetical protein
MANSISRTPRSFNRESSEGRIRESFVYIGIVKKNTDDQRMGRLAVWIPEFGGNPEDETSWIIVGYCSPFAGSSDPRRVNPDSQTMEGSQTSYGFWAVPPDLENQVLVVFANGDLSKGFWIGGLWQQNMNHMVPGIAANIPTDPNWSAGIQVPASGPSGVAPVSAGSPVAGSAGGAATRVTNADGTTGTADRVADSDRSRQAFEFFVSRGWTREQAAGIVGNLIQESGLRPNALNRGENAQGIAQWRADRLTNFRNRYRVNMMEATFEQQLDFVHFEMTQGAERRAGDRVRATTTVQDATVAVDRYYERSAGLHRGGRIANASRVYETNGGANGTPIPPAADPPDEDRSTVRDNGVATSPPTRAATPSDVTQIAPVVEYNKRNADSTTTPRRPIFTPLAEGILAQGLGRDFERGLSSTSARRRSPSDTYGLLSPRGNTIHIDDDPRNEFIRIRSRGGAQILVHETTGYVYINSKNGNAWMEISDRGVDVYSKNSISMRAEMDFNVRADRNIFFDAGNSIALKAGQNIMMEAGEKIVLKSGDSISASASANFAVAANGNLTLRASGVLRTQAGGDISSAAGGNQIRTGTIILDNSGSAPAIGDAPTPTPVPATRSGVASIATRVPTHEPWDGHPRSDVPPPLAAYLDGDDMTRIGGRAGQAMPGDQTTDPDDQTVQTGDGERTVPGTQDGPRCVSGARTLPVSTEVFTAIREASESSGVSFGYLMATAHQESTFNPNARARTSSASGLFQFIDSTWAGMVSRHGGRLNVGAGDRLTARGSALMGAEFARENQAFLSRAGLPTGNTELYMAHFLGAGGATSMLRELQRNPNRPAAEVNPAAARSNRTVFYRPDGTPRTVAEIRAWAEAKIEPRAQAYARQAGLPAPCQREGNATEGIVIGQA